MAEITTELQIQFSSFDDEMPFELVVDGTDEVGSAPVQVASTTDISVMVRAFGLASWQGAINGFVPLRMVAPGRKRIKVYCPTDVMPAIRIIVDNGETTFREVRRVEELVTWTERNHYYYGMSLRGDTPNTRYRIDVTEEIVDTPVNKAVLIGRRYEPVVEAITWTGEVRKRLRYPYDHPGVEIIQQTTFRDKSGAIVPTPSYDPLKAEFYTEKESFGAVVVRYSPGFALYEIIYDTGQQVASTQLFEEMQRAWMFGDITKVEVPPVRLIALSDRKAVTGSFERKIWPQGLINVSYELTSASSAIYNQAQETYWADPNNISPGGTGSSNQGSTSISTADQTGTIENWTEIPGTRETMMNRLYLDSNDPNAYVDVELVTYLECRDDQGRTFKLRMLNGVSDS
ncbi:MAG: hypothetical protein HQL95_10985 [Magnetococcales bacterium]|nr:hypothetical protein [Magnetococcales bacterium]